MGQEREGTNLTMSTTEHTTTEERGEEYTLRFEATVSWERPVNHDRDDPSRLQERLSRIPVDGDVTVTEFTDTSATVLVETTEKDMGHSVSVIPTKIRKVVRNYNNRVIGGDSLNKAPRPVRKKYIRWACEGKDRPTGSNYVDPETWEKAEKVAEGLDLEGAPSLEPTIETRTLEA